MASASEACSAESADSSLVLSGPGSATRSGNARSSRGRGRSSPSTGPASPATTTSEPSSQPPAAPTSFAADSRARTFPKREARKGYKGNARASGGSLPGSFAWFDPATSSWRMFHRSLDSGWAPFLATWPRSGMMQSGTAYRLQPLVRHIRETGSGSWPTPTVADTYTDRLESSQQEEGSRHSLSLSGKGGDAMADAGQVGRSSPIGDLHGRKQDAPGSRQVLAYANGKWQLQQERGEPYLRRWLGHGGWWATEPDVGRVADGVPARVDRIAGLGNSVCPANSEWVGGRINMIEEERAFASEGGAR